MLDLQSMRQEYKKSSLDTDSVDKDPFKQFERWFHEAQEAEVAEPNAMILATANKEGVPNIRAVLLKIFDQKGFVFFTNYTSVKALEIAENPNVALESLWLDLERQVRITGHCEKISTAESLAYFTKRSRGSKIGAWVSHQSQIISSRKLLMLQAAKIKERFKNGDIPLPDFWGGYRVMPKEIEFWQGREDRLHDRIVYRRENGQWQINRVAP